MIHHGEDAVPTYLSFRASANYQLEGREFETKVSTIPAHYDYLLAKDVFWLGTRYTCYTCTRERKEKAIEMMLYTKQSYHDIFFVLELNIPNKSFLSHDVDCFLCNLPVSTILLHTYGVT